MCVYFCYRFCCDHQVWGRRLRACTIGEDFEKGIFPVDCRLRTTHGLFTWKIPKMCKICIRTDLNLKRMVVKLQDCRQAFAEKWPEYDLDNLEGSAQVQHVSDHDRTKLEKDAEACTSMMEEVTGEIDAYERGDSERRLLEKARRQRQKRNSGRDSGIGLDDDSSDAASVQSTPSKAPSATMAKGKTLIPSALPKMLPVPRKAPGSLPVPRSHHMAPKMSPVPRNIQTPKVISPPKTRTVTKGTTAPRIGPKIIQPPRNSFIAPPLSSVATSSIPAKTSSPAKTACSKGPVMPGTKNALKTMTTPTVHRRAESLAPPAARTAVKAAAQPIRPPTMPGKRVSGLQRPGFAKK